jgi:hypothetical protein
LPRMLGGAASPHLPSKVIAVIAGAVLVFAFGVLIASL